MSKLPILGLISHQRRVCMLYKKALRATEEWYPKRDLFRYQAVLLRARFDEHKNEPDMMKARKLIQAAEDEIFEWSHPIPKRFPNSPGGVAFEREVIPPDWVLDYWHPLEKAAYPEYFARREQRKKEFVIWWEKQYGKYDPNEASHHH